MVKRIATRYGGGGPIALGIGLLFSSVPLVGVAFIAAGAFWEIAVLAGPPAYEWVAKDLVTRVEAASHKEQAGKELRVTLISIRGELDHVSTLLKERIEPDIGEHWYPNDPGSVGLLPQGQWNAGHTHIAQEKLLQETYFTVQRAYNEIGRIDRVSTGAWNLRPESGTLAARQVQLQRSVEEDGLDAALDAIAAGIAAIDASLEEI